MRTILGMLELRLEHCRALDHEGGAADLIRLVQDLGGTWRVLMNTSDLYGFPDTSLELPVQP